MKSVFHYIQGKNNSEDQYYTNLFVENEDWNKPFPNEEETMRWNIIEKFIHNIIENKTGEGLEILDLGCGRGWLANLLSHYGDVKGVEPIKSVVAYANTLFSTLDITSSFSPVTWKHFLSDGKF